MDWSLRRTYPAGVFDVLLGCDLIYDAAIVPLLVTCVDALLAADGVFFYCYGGSRCVLRCGRLSILVLALSSHSFSRGHFLLSFMLCCNVPPPRHHLTPGSHGGDELLSSLTGAGLQVVTSIPAPPLRGNPLV